MDNTLFLMVTCSLDRYRNQVTLKVLRKLNSLLIDINQINNLVVFDNASKYQDHFQFINKASICVKSKKNLGLWSAINWILLNYKKLNQKKFKYIYIIESDTFHWDLSVIKDCEKFLVNNKSISSIRTKEFSVKNKWRYDKKLRFLPFHKQRSAMFLNNVITNKRAKFKKNKNFPNIYTTNLHPMLPGLHDIKNLRKVFENLSKLKNFTELDFCRESMNYNENIGILDKGIYFDLTRTKTGFKLSESFFIKEEMTKAGYQTTRESKILNYKKEEIS